MDNKDTDESNTSPVIAYRVGQLEKVVDIRLKELRDEFVDFKKHYATKVELQAMENHATLEHDRLSKEIKRVDTDVQSLQTCVEELKQQNISLTLAQKIVFTVVGIILTAVCATVVNKVIG